VLYQISALDGLAKVAGSKVQYVKPHGALYNTIAHDKRQAADVIAGIKAIDQTLVLMDKCLNQFLIQPLRLLM
jgi:UPF0271 protein